MKERKPGSEDKSGIPELSPDDLVGKIIVKQGASFLITEVMLGDSFKPIGKLGTRKGVVVYRKVGSEEDRYGSVDFDATYEEIVAALLKNGYKLTE